MCKYLIKIWGCGCHNPYKQACSTPEKKCVVQKPEPVNNDWLKLAKVRANPYFDPKSAPEQKLAASPNPNELIQFVSPICGQCKQNALVNLRNRITDAEQTHRHLEEKYHYHTMEYFQSLIMHQKMAGDGPTSLPYQLFIEPRTIALDAWHKDWDDADAMIQRAFRLTAGWPVNIEDISALMDKADKTIATIIQKLKELSTIIDQQIEDTLHMSIAAVGRDPMYRQLELKDQDAILAWVMTLPETQRQTDLGKSTETIVDEIQFAFQGADGIECSGTLVKRKK